MSEQEYTTIFKGSIIGAIVIGVLGGVAGLTVDTSGIGILDSSSSFYVLFFAYLGSAFGASTVGPAISLRRAGYKKYKVTAFFSLFTFCSLLAIWMIIALSKSTESFLETREIALQGRQATYDQKQDDLMNWVIVGAIWISSFVTPLIARYFVRKDAK